MAIPPLRKLAVHYLGPLYPLRPTSLFVSPTLRCSARCAHCTVWAEKGRGKPELEPHKWRRIFNDPFFSAVHTFWISGGEPTMREDLAEIAVAAVESLPKMESITIATNALDPKAVEAVLEKIMPYIEERKIYAHLHLSLDGPPEIHDRIRGVEGAYASLLKTVEMAKSMQRNSKPVGWSFNCVIGPGNAGYLEAALETARNLMGQITFNIADVSSGYYRSREGKSLTEDDRRKILPFIEKLLADADAYHRRHYETMKAVIMGTPRPYRCETMEATMYLDPDSSLYACPRTYGEADIRIAETPPAEAWKKLFSYRARIRRELCPTCSLGCSFGEGLSLRELLELL